MPQALLLTGLKGSGLFTLASHIVEQNGTLLATVTPEAKTSTAVPIISVERVRDLYNTTRTRLHGPHFVVIDDAESMNQMAQNALLKLLEEPNESIHFILTAHSPDKLLPTIRSRLQQFVVPPISDVASRKLLDSLGVDDELNIKRLLYIASGLPAELTRLATNSESLKQLGERVAKARDFVEGNTYQRLIVIQSLKDDRAGALLFIETILFLLRRTLKSSATVSTARLIENLVAASEAIRANGNIRLQLMRAVV